MNGTGERNLQGQPREPAAPGMDAAALALTHRHLRFGWWALLVYLTLGLVLEMFHGFKVNFYLDDGNVTRRLMWTLAHAHGTLLSLINIAFGATLPLRSAPATASIRLASRCLIGAAILLPVGFFLGGVKLYGGDPSLFVLLVPLGAVLLIISVMLIASSRAQP